MTAQVEATTREDAIRKTVAGEFCLDEVILEENQDEPSEIEVMQMWAENPEPTDWNKLMEKEASDEDIVV